jgi:hypothetical protein
VGQVRGSVPDGFDAYVRVFHRAELDSHPEESSDITGRGRELSWTEVARSNGTVFHSSAQWAAISGRQYDTTVLADGSRVSPPAVGRLGLDQLAVLAAVLVQHTTTPENGYLGFWAGWAEMHTGSLSPVAAANGHLLSLPGREYVLLAGDLRELETSGWTAIEGVEWRSRFDGPTPNLVWPGDLAWALATEIDFDSTLIGGSPALVDAILSSEELESREVSSSTDLTVDGDRLNK